MSNSYAISLKIIDLICNESVLKVLYHYIFVSFFNIWTYDLVFRLNQKSCGYIFLIMKTWCDVHGFLEEIFLFFIDYMYIKVIYIYIWCKNIEFVFLGIKKFSFNLNSSLY